MSDFKVGVGQVDYTPPAGLPMGGHMQVAKGVHDPLYSRALVLENASGNKVALVGVDILMLERDHVALMRRHIRRHCGIPPENILIAATHNHSAPAAVPVYGMPTAADGDIEVFLTKAAEAVVLANKHLTESMISIGHGREERISFNRRLECKDGRTHMNWEPLEPDFVLRPHGPIDPEIVTLTVEQAGRPRAAVVNFALHPAILDYENELYTADYPGYLAEGMSKIIGSDFAAIFLNGCCGNVNHVDYMDKTAPRRGYVMAQRVGYMLAAGAKKAMDEAAPMSGGMIAVSREMVKLERIRISEEQHRWSKAQLERVDTRPELDQLDGLPAEHRAQAWIDMYKKYEQSPTDKVEVMAIRIGDVGVIGLPGEIFCELGMEIKKHSPAKHTMVVELANDWIGYIPNQEAGDQGGYETTPGATRYESSAGEKLTESALRQLKELFA